MVAVGSKNCKVEPTAGLTLKVENWLTLTQPGPIMADSCSQIKPHKQITPLFCMEGDPEETLFTILTRAMLVDESLCNTMLPELTQTLFADMNTETGGAGAPESPKYICAAFVK